MAIRYLSGINVDSNTLFVDSTNNRVGIGTGSPTYTLDVVGSIRSTGNEGKVIINSTAVSGKQYEFISIDTGNLGLYDGTSYRLWVSGAGNVGIGTTAPAQKLHVDGAIRLTSNPSVTGDGSSAQFWNGAGVGPIIAGANFQVRTNGDTTALHINSSQNVGIGTTSPSFKLDVNAGSNAGIFLQGSSDTRYHVFSSSSNDWVGYELRSSNVNSFAGGMFRNNASNNRVSLYNKNSEAISLMDTGNVGIGTTSPSYSLDVAGTSRSDLHIFRSNQSAPTADAFIFRPADNTIALGTANAERMRITVGGNVLIGTTTDNGFKLNVSGNATFISGNSSLSIIANDTWATNFLKTDMSASAVAHILGKANSANNSATLRYYHAADANAGNYIGLGFYGNDDLLRVFVDAGVRLTGYGSGTKTGTVAYNLGVTSTGNIIELPGGVVDGSGTANYVSKWSDANTLTDSVIYENGGNIGIGVTNADYPLTVGSINVGGAGANLGVVINSVISTAIPASSVKAIIGATNSGFGYAAGSLLIQPRTGVNAVFALATEGTEKLRVTHDGNVGIGTTAPGAKLDVRFDDGVSNGEHNVLASFSRNGSGPLVIGYRADGTNVTSALIRIGDALPLTIGTTSSNQAFTLLDNGNVGIGTTSPGNKLAILAPDATGVPTLGTNQGHFGIFNGTGAGSYGLLGGVINDGNAYLQVQRIDGTATAYNMLLQPSGGNVGIGTTNPVLFSTGWGRVLGVAASSGYSVVQVAGSSGNGGEIDFGGGSIRHAAVASLVNSNLAFFTNATNSGDSLTERMRITYDGNVGIGTTAPGAKLEVVSGSTPFIRATFSASYYTDFDTNGIDFRGPAQTFDFKDNGSSVVRIASGGNVGIGTTAPGAKLDVAGTARFLGNASTAPSVIFNNSAASGTSEYYAEFNSGATVLGRMFRGNGAAGVVDNGLNIDNFSGFQVRVNQLGGSGGSINLMGGNVGIGTTAPSEKLEVNGNINLISNGGYFLNGALTLFPYANDTYIRPYTSSGSINFQNYSGSSTLSITAAGNVGIGTTAPVGKLSILVDGGTTWTQYLSTPSAVNKRNSIGFHDSAGANIAAILTDINADNTADFGISVPNGSPRLVIKASGNVGIGTTAPTAKLEVVGAAIVRDSPTTNDWGLRLQNTNTGGWGVSQFFNIYGYASSPASDFSALQIRADYPGYGRISFVVKEQAQSSALESLVLRGNGQVYMNAGNVGIGTTSPNAKLNVNTDAMGVTVSDASGISLTNATAAAAGAQQMSPTLKWSGQGWKTTATAASQNVSFISFLTPIQGSTAPSGILNFASSINGGAYATRMTLTTGGELSVSGGFSATSGFFSSTVTNVIGNLTTTPTDGVVIVTGAATAVIPVRISPRLRISGTAWNTGGTPASNTMNWTIDNLPTSGNPPTSALRFSFDRNNGGYSTLVSFTSAGNVGIGTADPDTPLGGAKGFVINSGAGNDVQIRLQNNTTGSGGTDGGLLSISGSLMYLWNYENSDLIFGTNSTERARILSNGNVGINNASPSYKLDVTGDARINTGALGVNIAPSATDGRIDASNDIVAFSSSDLRLKENIKPIENALDKVKSLTGVEFDWKPELKHAHGYEGHDTGVIAQEVQEVMPTAIRTNDTGYLAVRYEKLIGLLIEANKELAARVEELESKLK